jgi:outer membrane protein assembly factor BamE (lipoprotein component of BamABCDE complex)
MYKLHKLFVLVFFLTACGKSLPTLDQVDLNEWKSDKNGCDYKRVGMIEAIRTQREKLQGLEELQIVALLGKPDQNELFKRNQKFFYYYLQPGKPCGNDSIPPLKLSIRFNAMGLAKEVMVE